MLYVYWSVAGSLYSLLCHTSFKNILGIVELPFQKRNISHEMQNVIDMISYSDIKLYEVRYVILVYSHK